MLTYNWPQDRRYVTKHLRKYWPFRNELTYDENYIMKGNAVIVSYRAREHTTKRLTKYNG